MKCFDLYFCVVYHRLIFAFTDLSVNCTEKNFHDQEMKTISKYEKTIYYIQSITANSL